MAPRNPDVQDWQIQMRDVRKRLADLDLHIIQAKEEVLTAIITLANSLDTERTSRKQMEAEEAQYHADLKKKIAEEASTNGSTQKKIQAEVQTQLEAKRWIDWPTLLRKTIIPTAATVITAALVTAALAVIFPAFGQFLISAFTKR